MLMITEDKVTEKNVISKGFWKINVNRFLKTLSMTSLLAYILKFNYKSTLFVQLFVYLQSKSINILL